MKYLLAISLCFGLYLTSCSNAPTNKNPQVSAPISAAYQDLNVSEFKEQIKASKNAVVIDVRTPKEIADGKIDGALEININGSEFEKKLAELDKDKDYYIYCRSGGRSSKASKFMIGMGFKNVSNLKGGYLAWSKS